MCEGHGESEMAELLDLVLVKSLNLKKKNSY